jgi:hypothetical protein
MNRYGHFAAGRLSDETMMLQIGALTQNSKRKQITRIMSHSPFREGASIFTVW